MGWTDTADTWIAFMIKRTLWRSVIHLKTYVPRINEKINTVLMIEKEVICKKKQGKEEKTLNLLTRKSASKVPRNIFHTF